MSYGYRCKSGRHVWTEAADAQKCCNGFIRRFVHREDEDRARQIQDPTYRPMTDPEFAGCGNVWHRNGAYDPGFRPPPAH